MQTKREPSGTCFAAAFFLQGRLDEKSSPFCGMQKEVRQGYQPAAQILEDSLPFRAGHTGIT